MSTKHIRLTPDDMVDVTMETEASGPVVVHIVVNYRARFKETGDRWHEIYRVDTCHRYLHEQRFWIGPDPIPLNAGTRTLEQVMYETFDKISREYLRLKQLYRKEKLGEYRR
jgi:hypothetical protein